MLTTSTSMPHMAPILKHFSPASLEQISLLIQQKSSAETPYFYPIAFITLFFVLYLFAQILHNFVLPRAIGGRRWYKEIKPEHRRTMVIYVMQIIVTAAALALQLSTSALLKNDFTVVSINILRAAGCLIAGLYIFELIYRYRMTYPMIFHHAITCFVMSLALVMLERLQDPSFALTSVLWMYQATTEQTSFLALFMYRLSVPAKTLRPLFRISAIQSLVFKFASIGGTVFVWSKYQRQGEGDLYRAWDGLFWVCTVGLALTQVWGAWVVWSMGDSLEKRYQQKQQEQEVEAEKEFTPLPVPVLEGTTVTTTAESSRAASSQWSNAEYEKTAYLQA